MKCGVKLVLFKITISFIFLWVLSFTLSLYRLCTPHIHGVSIHTHPSSSHQKIYQPRRDHFCLGYLEYYVCFHNISLSRKLRTNQFAFLFFQLICHNSRERLGKPKTHCDYPAAFDLSSFNDIYKSMHSSAAISLHMQPKTNHDVFA